MISEKAVIKNLWICFVMVFVCTLILGIVISPWIMSTCFFWLVAIIDLSKQIKKEAKENESKPKVY